MNNIKNITKIILFAILMLIPASAMAQNVNEITTQNNVAIDEITSQDDTIGPVGTVGVYAETYDELTEWWDDRESIPIIENIPITGMAVKYGEEIFIGVDESDQDQIDSITEKFDLLYPDLNIVVGTIGEGKWHTGDSVCLSKTDDCNPQQAGMKAYGLNSDNTTAQPFTITMGYETEDGEKGFLAPKHSFGLDDTGNAVYRTISGTTPVDKHGTVLLNTGLNSRNTLDSDSVFVEFDKEKRCIYNHPRTGLCLVEREGNYIETVKYLTIFSEDNTKYTVTGSTGNVDSRDRVKFSGAVSGEIDSIVLYDNARFSMSNPFEGSPSRIQLTQMLVLYSNTSSGDSGAPIYTHPNSTNEVDIVGVVSGSINFRGNDRSFGFYWDEIADDLDLDPIP